jgi:hypothetical protein
MVGKAVDAALVGSQRQRTHDTAWAATPNDSAAAGPAHHASRTGHGSTNPTPRTEPPWTFRRENQLKSLLEGKGEW